jgi:hypothetical protein
MFSEPYFTFHCLGSLEPPPLTQLSHGSHVLFFLLMFLYDVVCHVTPLPFLFPVPACRVETSPLSWEAVVLSGCLPCSQNSVSATLAKNFVWFNTA